MKSLRPGAEDGPEAPLLRLRAEKQNATGGRTGGYVWTQVLSEFSRRLGEEDLNPHLRFQRPLSYH